MVKQRRKNLTLFDFFKLTHNFLIGGAASHDHGDCRLGKCLPLFFYEMFAISVQKSTFSTT